MNVTVESSRSSGSPRVFIVHGDEAVRGALQVILHDGCEAHELSGIAAAFEKGRHTRVDLVVLDAAIVKDQGVDVLGLVSEAHPAAPILLVADEATDAFAHGCLSAGAHAVLTPPFQLARVREMVDRLLAALPASLPRST